MTKCFILLLCTLWVIPFTLYPQTNRALFIVIEKYSLTDYGWEELHCLNDYRLLQPMCVTRDFEPANIWLLKDNMATKEGIISALNLLKQQTRKGDYIYIHFSGHGQQMADDNYDEEDGWDEAFIPYDAYYRYEANGYGGENHLRDDELERHLNAIRMKAGPAGHVFMMMDACHSATSNRDEDDDFIRGTAYRFDPVNYKPERDVSKQKTKSANHARMASLTIFTACQADETNYEYRTRDGEYYGRLSYALAQVLMNGKIYTTQGFMEAMKESDAYSISHRDKQQTPYFESTIGNKTFKLGR